MWKSVIYSTISFCRISLFESLPLILYMYHIWFTASVNSQTWWFSEAFLSFSLRIHQMAVKINPAKYVQCGWLYDSGADKNMLHCLRQISLGDGSVMYTDRERNTMWMSTECERAFVHVSVEILSCKLELYGHEVTDIFFIFQLLTFFSLFSLALHFHLHSSWHYK